METKVGEQLRTLRESKNISLKTVSQKSKIGLSLLQHLEADEYYLLPNKIYVLGFIKTYAVILNVDEKPLIAAYESTFKKEEPVQNIKFAPVPGEAKRNPVPTLIMTSVVSGLLCFGGILFIYKNSQKKLAELKKPLPVIKVVEKAPPKIEVPVVKEVVPPPVEELYSFKKDEKALVEAHVPLNIQNSVVEGKQNLFLKAYKDSSWITYKIDNEPIRKFILEKDKTLLLRGDEIRLFIGNVNATLIFLNNRPLEIISKSGVKSLIFPEKNKDKYKVPFFVFKEDGTVSTSEEIPKTN
jgi:cytoskeleton protein RodZ